uniref:RRM domain-containing protein n=1 Tax=Neovison vison TaxID=452646 RepID=A0A8C7AR49_NEOVI
MGRSVHLPFLSHTLVPLPTEAWLQSLSRDPEAQGRGAWKPALGSGGGDRREEEPGEAEEDQEDEKADSLLSLWSGEDLAERPKPDQELEAVKPKLWAMEQTQGPETPGERGKLAVGAPGGRGARLLQRPLHTGGPYVWQVDYGGTAEELGAHFSPREFRRITILCAKFSGHPKGSLCIELDTKSSAQAAVGLDETIAPRRVIKVLPKRTSLPGIRSTDRGGFRGQPGAGGGLFPRSGVRGGAGFRSRRRNRGRGPRWGGACADSVGGGPAWGRGRGPRPRPRPVSPRRGGGSPFRGVRRAEGRVRF